MITRTMVCKMCLFENADTYFPDEGQAPTMKCRYHGGDHEMSLYRQIETDLDESLIR
jgi:hypothetical protein